MLGLNLLPPEEKTEIQNRFELLKAIDNGSVGFFYVFIFLTLLASVWLYLAVQLNSLEKIADEIESSPQNLAFNQFKKEIDAANQKLRNFSLTQDKEIKYSFFTEKLSELSGDGIKFNSLSIEKEKIILEGRAATREALLVFKDKLMTSSDFQNLDAPLSNFLKSSNIDFSFNFQINPHTLPQNN